MTADATSTFEVVDFCTVDTTPIPAIQGSGDDPALTGVRTTRGVVVGDYEGGASGTCAASTSRTRPVTATPPPPTRSSSSTASNENSVALGDVVTVRGTVVRVPGPDPDLGVPRRTSSVCAPGCHRARDRRRRCRWRARRPSSATRACSCGCRRSSPSPSTSSSAASARSSSPPMVASSSRPTSYPAGDGRRGPPGREQPQPDPHRRRVQRAEPRPDPLRPGRRPAEREQHPARAATPSPASPAS